MLQLKDADIKIVNGSGIQLRDDTTLLFYEHKWFTSLLAAEGDYSHECRAIHMAQTIKCGHMTSKKLC